MPLDPDNSALHRAACALSPLCIIRDCLLLCPEVLHQLILCMPQRLARGLHLLFKSSRPPARAPAPAEPQLARSWRRLRIKQHAHARQCPGFGVQSVQACERAHAPPRTQRTPRKTSPRPREPHMFASIAPETHASGSKEICHAPRKTSIDAPVAVRTCASLTRMIISGKGGATEIWSRMRGFALRSSLAPK